MRPGPALLMHAIGDLVGPWRGISDGDRVRIHFSYPRTCTLSLSSLDVVIDEIDWRNWVTWFKIGGRRMKVRFNAVRQVDILARGT